MPQKTTRKPGAFAALSIESQVRRAMPLAQHIVITGVSDRGDEDSDQEELCIRVMELVGHDGPACPDLEHPKYGEGLAAAYAIGLAVGQLLQPGLFLKGGGQ